MNFTLLLATVLAAVAPDGRAADRSSGPAPRWQSGFSRRSEIEFRLLLETLPAAAYTCDASGLITYYNRRAVELWGRAPELRDAEDRFCGSFRLFSADGTPIPHERCWTALALEQDRSFDGEEIVIEREDGSRRTVLAHASPIHGPRGRVTGAVNVLVDISERKRAEEILRQADRSKSELLAALSHELRNPLAPMQAALELMRRGDSATVERAQEIIGRQIEQLAGVVDRLLDVSPGGATVGPAPPATQEGIRILVVDDNEDAAQSLADLLRISGLETHVAHDGATALALGSELKPSAVLLDIGMRGMDGYETARRIRSSWGAGVQIIAVTGWGYAEDVRRSKEAGFDHHLVKPVDFDQLQRLLTAARV